MPTDPDGLFFVTVSTTVAGAERAAVAAEHLAANLREAVADLPPGSSLSINVVAYDADNDDAQES